MMNKKIIALKMERQHLINKADESEYIKLYRDLQPGYNVYWNGFGDPPSLTYRADFDDIEFNRKRQSERLLLKGRFAGGNLGWIMAEDFELFACAFIKPIAKMTKKQMDLYNLIEHEGPLTIQQMKETTGLLVKEITPALHRLQEAFMIYEDQYDGEWDRGWYRFDDMFPDINLERYTKIEALKILIERFAYRHVLFDAEMIKSYYKLSAKDIKAAIDSFDFDTIVSVDGGYMLKTDVEILNNHTGTMPKKVYAIHKNDFLYRSNEHQLKEQYKRDGIETIFYVLIDGEFCGAAYGKFRFGPPDFEDLYINHPEADSRKDEIIEAVKKLSHGKSPDKYNGVTL